MKIIIIIQARMGSTRLPGKILLPLSSTTVLDYVVTRCRNVHSAAKVIVATTILPVDDVVAKWCEDNMVPYFRGSEEDVLSRYYECAKHYEPDYVIRVSADCPFTDYEMAESIIQMMKQNPSENVELFQSEYPRGLDVEMFSYQALERYNREGLEQRHREHVTLFAKENLELFKSISFKADKSLGYPQLRLTLDTPEDYNLCQAIAQHFHDNKLVRASEVVAYLLANPDIAALNENVDQKPVLDSTEGIQSHNFHKRATR